MERASQAAEEASVCGRGCPQAILERRHLNDGRARVSRVRRNGEMTRGGDRPGAPENALRNARGSCRREADWARRGRLRDIHLGFSCPWAGKVEKTSVRWSNVTACGQKQGAGPLLRRKIYRKVRLPVELFTLIEEASFSIREGSCSNYPYGTRCSRPPSRGGGRSATNGSNTR